MNWVCVFAMASLFFVSGCVPTPSWNDLWLSGSKKVSSDENYDARAASGLKQADRALQQGKNDAALRLYENIAYDTRLSSSFREQAYEKSAAILLKMERRNSALALLQSWKEMSPNVEDSETWRLLWVEAGGRLNEKKQGNEIQEPSSEGKGMPCVVLAVPITGSNASVGKRVVLGAQTAARRMSETGRSMEVRVTDTNRAEWIQELHAMPRQCVAVGGMMGTGDYRKAASESVASARKFFVFRPRIDGGEEGKNAWRFFNSSADQYEALLRFGSEAGVSAYGIFAPDTGYGRRQMQAFQSHALSSGSSIASYATYDSRMSKEMADSARAFLQNGSVKKGRPAFQAVFLPDKWANSALAAQYLEYQGGSGLLFMGPALWGQNLASRKNSDAFGMDWAVFPSPWYSDSDAPETVRLKQLMNTEKSGADFWTALGYDFVRFADALHLSAESSSESVTEAIMQAQKMDWSMAPISWNRFGQASQHMFIMRFENGLVQLANAADIREIQKARKKK